MSPPFFGRTKTKMANYTFDIDEKIKNKFRLYAGDRSLAEDQKICEKVLDLCFDELISFLQDNLDKEQIDSLNKKLGSLSNEDLSKDKKDDKITQVLFEYAQKIDNFRFKWDKRLDYFLNQLVYSSIKKNG